MAGHPKFWPTIDRVLSRLHVEAWAPYLRHYVGHDTGDATAGHDCDINADNFPATGKGMVTVIQVGQPHGHAMPWENGLAIDPQTLNTYTLSQLRDIGFVIVRIVRLFGGSDNAD
jgi:hypothetical protein